MPCMIDRKLTFGEIQINQLRKEVDDLTRCMCALTQRLIEKESDCRDKLTPEFLIYWLEEHKKNPMCELYKENK